MKIKIAFVCVGNACRSQMAEGFARKYASEVKNWDIKIYSAGTHPAFAIVPQTVEVMKEVGVDISGQYPKTLDDIPDEFDLVFTMGCNVDCPALPARYREDWGLDDPVGMPLEFFRKTRDTIDYKVKKLFELIGNSKDVDEVILKLKDKP